MPTRRLPGMGASILMECAAKSSARLFSRAVILVSFTPVGGFSVYWVTLGPTLAPSMSTAMLKLLKVSLMVWAVPWTSPASAFSCFWFNKSIGGNCQFGSVVVVKASWSSLADSFWAVFFRLLSREESLLSVGTPSLSLNLSSSLRVFRSTSPCFLLLKGLVRTINTLGEIRKEKKSAKTAKITNSKLDGTLLRASSVALPRTSPI